MGTNLAQDYVYPKLYMYMYLAKSNLFIEPFYSHGQLELQCMQIYWNNSKFFT